VIAAIVMSGFLIGSIAARYAIPKWGMNWVIVTSLAIMLGASMILIGLGLLGWLPALIIAALEYVFWFGVGLLIPNTAAGVMMSHPNVAGAAAAFLGFTQMCTAAAISLLQGLIYDGTVFPMLTTQLALGAVAWAVWHCLKKYAV
jgi:DHA1 family bicyclomycin/chloramphenicol resistance-like MFS transporter